jgi:hypothetical protein
MRNESPTRRPEQLVTLEAAVGAVAFSLVAAWVNISTGRDEAFWASLGLSVLSTALFGKALALGRGWRFRTASAVLLLAATAWLGIVVIALILGPH